MYLADIDDTRAEIMKCAISSKSEANTASIFEKELFDKFKACYDEMIQITECQTFIKGFKLGARFVMACIESDSDIYDNYA